MSEVFKDILVSIKNLFEPIRPIFAFIFGQLLIIRKFLFGNLEPILGPAVPYIKIFSFVVSGLLIFGIILCITKSGYASYRLDTTLDFWKLASIFKRRALRAWIAIKKMMKSKDPKDWRQALIKSEDLVNAVLKQAGVPGKNLDERLNGLNIEQLSILEDVKKIHKAVTKIKSDVAFEITKEEIESLLDVYESALKELWLIE